MNENFLLPGDEIIKIGDIQSLSETIDWGLIDFAIPKLWEKNKGDGVTVMVCDTGISEHEDLNQNIIFEKAKSFVPEEDYWDKQGHGTSVAGIISAKESGFGIVGVAPNTKIIPVKVLSNNGFIKTVSSLEMALRYAKTIKPDIINMSLGGPSKISELFHKMLKDIYMLDIPVVCAMGNSGAKFSCYPAEYPETIGVTSYKKDRSISNFSSRSANADFALPGEDILTTVLNNNYAIVKGTSFSAPFLTGIIAIIISEYKKYNLPYTVQTIKNILIKSCEDYGKIGKDSEYGYGIIDVDLLSTLF